MSVGQIKSSCLQGTGRHHTAVIAVRQLGSIDDAVTKIARGGTERMLAAAMRAEADAEDVFQRR
jgi:hypothetical protein